MTCDASAPDATSVHRGTSAVVGRARARKHGPVIRVVMRLETYEEIRDELASTPCDCHPDFDDVRARHPDVTLDALVSIYSQESSRKIRAHHGRHVRAIESHAKRYLLGEDVFSVAALSLIHI